MKNVNFSTAAYDSSNVQVHIPWKRTSSTKENKTVTTKHRLDATDKESEKVECKYYILTRKEAKELYILWRMEIETKIELLVSSV